MDSGKIEYYKILVSVVLSLYIGVTCALAMFP